MAEAWVHMQKIVSALEAVGNPVAEGGFRPTMGGYECLMRLPLDFDLLTSLVPSDDKNVHLARESDMDMDMVRCETNTQS